MTYINPVVRVIWSGDMDKGTEKLEVFQITLGDVVISLDQETIHQFLLGLGLAKVLP